MSGPTLTVVTAGHVDHGKTTLVHALTGADTDRLPAERERGVSIESGFAELELPSGQRLGLVDAPGHERFVRHMVAGASGVDAYLLCVAADDGVMPQTLEHLDVLALLGIEHGVVAITRSDLADPAAAAAATREVVGQDLEIVAVASTTGEGLADLRDALARATSGLKRRTADGPGRLFVDRAFTIPGVGTVVTGTLWGAPIERGEAVHVLPGGAKARVRSIEAHGRPLDQAHGGRVALNLIGAGRTMAERGRCVVSAADEWRATEQLDVALTWLPGAPGPLRTGRRLQAFLGTAETPATCVLLDREQLEPGERCYAQLRLEGRVPARRDDRLILRSSDPATVGGAVVVDAAPERHGRGARAGNRLAALEQGGTEGLASQLLAEAGPEGVAAGRLEEDALVSAGAVILPNGVAVSADLLRPARRALMAAVADEPVQLDDVPALTGLGRSAAAGLVAALLAERSLTRQGPAVGPPDADASEREVEAVSRALAEAGLRGLSAGALAERVDLDGRRCHSALAVLRETERAVSTGELWLDAEVLQEAERRLVDALGRQPLGLGDLRDLWGVDRRRALALAVYFDAAGVTSRHGDVRRLRRGGGGPRRS